MKYQIEKETRPVYLQLYRLLRDDIVNGIYPYKSKLPSKRGLAEETGVSTITVEHAYAILCDEGYAEAKEHIRPVADWCADEIETKLSKKLGGN